VCGLTRLWKYTPYKYAAAGIRIAGCMFRVYSYYFQLQLQKSGS
jgi:hypothetical protein